MPNRNTYAFQGEGGNPLPPGGNDNQVQQFHGGNKVYKSGPLFLSSKGIGWTTWKKRWFILTRTSLVFFRSDPTIAPKKGGEVNLTLGGIDLNSSGSVVVKEDKKLLTVLFPDGRDGRAFTLKAETSEDLFEWKVALEEALANAPNAALVVGQNGMFKNDQGNIFDASDPSKDRQPTKSSVIGQPILLALEDVDGTASFLEKALKFLEEYGVQVEGILRQAADVDDVEHRIRQYEHGKREFLPDEDPHVIADCVKYILRELPSSPVPASCCNALLDAYRTERSSRVNAIRNALLETFPEPNRRLLQRILTMMQKVASYKNENRMSISAVAACMAPLLLRPLLAGECELGHNFDMGGDGSVQLFQAAAAANHAQAIVITLLEEYTNLFGEGSVSPELYSDSDDTGGEELSDEEEDGSYCDEDVDDEDEGSDSYSDDHSGHSSTSTTSETGKIERAIKHARDSSSSTESPEGNKNEASSLPQSSIENEGISNGAINHSSHASATPANESPDLLGETVEASVSQQSTEASNCHGSTVCRPAVRVRARGNNIPLESFDFTFEEDSEILMLESTKIELENRIAEEAKGNTLLKERLAKQKDALFERRLALQKDVARLQEQLQKEEELRMVLEAGLKNSPLPLAIPSCIDEATKAELEEIAQVEADITHLKQRADDLGAELNKQHELNSRFLNNDTGSQPRQNLTQQANPDNKNMVVDTNTTSQDQEKSVRSKQHDTSWNKADSQREKKNEPEMPVSKQIGTACNNPNSSGALIVAEPGIGRPASTTSKKFGPRNEGANASSASALSKLTNRLNFLKERRTQIANELLDLDRSLNYCQISPTPERKRLDPPPENHSSEKK